jgi:hypothetical protein
MGAFVVSCTSQYLIISLYYIITDQYSLVIEGKGRGSVVAFMIPERSDDKVEYSQFKFMLQLLPIRLITQYCSLVDKVLKGVRRDLAETTFCNV